MSCGVHVNSCQTGLASCRNLWTTVTTQKFTHSHSNTHDTLTHKWQMPVHVGHVEMPGQHPGGEVDQMLFWHENRPLPGSLSVSLPHSLIHCDFLTSTCPKNIVQPEVCEVMQHICAGLEIQLGKIRLLTFQPDISLWDWIIAVSLQGTEVMWLSKQ